MPEGEYQRLMELDANQLIDLILTVSKLGCETNNIKLDLDVYSHELISRSPKNAHFIREQLLKIPGIIRSNLDPDLKMFAIHKYSSAIIQLLLADIMNKGHARFFKIKHSKRIDAIIRKLLNKRRHKKESQIDIDNYKHNLNAQQDQLERMAILAISLSLKERIEFLEQHEIDLSNQVFVKIFDGLNKNGAFDGLKDEDGNLIILNEQIQKNLIEAVTNNYIEGLIEFSIERQMLVFPDPQNLNHQNNLRLYAYHNNGNNLFEEYNRHIAHQMSGKIQNALQGENIRVDSAGHKSLGNHFHNEIQNNKGFMMQIVSARREIIGHQSVLQNIHYIYPRNFKMHSLAFENYH